MWILVLAATQACYPEDDTRHALGVVLTGATSNEIDVGKEMISRASSVMVSEFNVQLVLVGEVVDEAVAAVPCMVNSKTVNTGLLLRDKESFGGIHVHMVSHCSEPAAYGGFVIGSDRACAGHTALYTDRSNYITLLHELGHLLAADHPGGVATPVCSVGGIMDYCNGDPHPYGTYDGKVQFHPDQKARICKHFSSDTECLYNPVDVLPHTVHYHSHAHAYLYVAVGSAFVLAAASLACIWYTEGKPLNRNSFQ